MWKSHHCLRATSSTGEHGAAASKNTPAVLLLRWRLQFGIDGCPLNLEQRTLNADNNHAIALPNRLATDVLG
jgi:hypothetical protein